jgi:hypothetical protein
VAGLTLNGISVDCYLDGTEISRVRFGESSRAFSGTPRRSWRATKREWRLHTGPLSNTDADAFQRLIDGEGHHWSFDLDHYSDKGLSASSANGTVTAGNAKWGSSRLRCNNVVEGFQIANPNSAWTVMFFRSTNATTTAYTHYVIRSDATKWVDGVQNNGASTSAFFSNSGTSTLTFNLGNGAALNDFDDVVFLPYTPPTSWMPTLYTFNNAQAFSALPRLTATGTVLKNATLTVLGEVMNASPVEFRDTSGTWTAGLSFEFVLREV